MNKFLRDSFFSRPTVLIRNTSLLFMLVPLLSLTPPVSISGTINDYSAVTNVGTWTVTLNHSAAFSAGDKTLLIQMKGAIISETDDQSYGDILSFGNAGNYEFHTISSIDGNVITFSEMVCADFTVEDLVQLVRIPVYGDVTVTGTLYASPWNGTTGGILALESTGTLTLNADIDVRDAGFNGGDQNGSAHTGGLTYICAFNSGQGGIKGEGITEVAQAACRGKLANGGGGGNDHNGGGGGGGNYGSGGLGGHGWKSNNSGNLSDFDKGGRGGYGLSELYEMGIPKLFLGGGGGGGHQNNGAAIAASNGGGIVILIAPTLSITTPVSIMANALDATDVYVNDGAGGGGAGGAVLFDVDNFISSENLTIDVSGGDGASVITRDQHGPGGGGAGGYVNSTQTLPAGIHLNVDGGDAGLFISTTNPSNPLSNTSHGATAGEAGNVVENLVLQVCSYPPVIDLDTGEGGYDYTTILVIHDLTVPIADSSITQISDDDNIYIYLAIIILENPLNGEYEGLEILGNLPEGLTATLAGDSHSLTISGTGTLAAYENAISHISYFNLSPSADMTTRQISVQVNDGGAESNIANTYINFTDVLLSLQWQFFTVNLQDNAFVLEWQLSQTLPTACFDIMRSTDGHIFEKIVTSPDPVFQLYRKSWVYRDPSDFISENEYIYYQVIFYTNNGFLLPSPVVKMRFQQEKGVKLFAYYDRENTQLDIQYLIGKKEKFTISVSDMQGNILWISQYPGNTPSGKIMLNTATWSAGIYVTSIESDGVRKSQRVVIR